MAGGILAPGQIDHPGEPVTRQTISMYPCPKCNQKIDVSNVTARSVVTCPKCENQTAIPMYDLRWWQKLPSIILAVIVSLMIGFAASVAAQYYRDYRNSPIHSVSPTPKQDNRGESNQ